MIAAAAYESDVEIAGIIFEKMYSGVEGKRALFLPETLATSRETSYFIKEAT